MKNRLQFWALSLWFWRQLVCRIIRVITNPELVKKGVSCSDLSPNKTWLKRLLWCFALLSCWINCLQFSGFCNCVNEGLMIRSNSMQITTNVTFSRTAPLSYSDGCVSNTTTTTTTEEMSWIMELWGWIWVERKTSWQEHRLGPLYSIPSSTAFRLSHHRCSLHTSIQLLCSGLLSYGVCIFNLSSEHISSSLL